MLKNISLSVKLRTIQLFNNIFSRFIPQQYKCSTVIPVIKSNGDKSMVSNYRPISLNICISKVLDKIIANRLWWFINQNKLLNSHQIGFRKGKSVHHNIMQLDFLISKALAKNSHISLIALDFAKAYDKIGVHSLVDQLKIWKVGPRIINYIINYMNNRKIQVKVNGHLSRKYPLQNGIPQGSPLSVVLFLIAYNRLCEIIKIQKSVDFYAYADDFYLIPKLSKLKNQNIDLINLFGNIDEWCRQSGAELSVTKCKHLHICRKRNCKCEILTNNHNNIESVNQIKVLGLIFTDKYRWNSHISHLRDSLVKRLNIIKCLANSKFNCNPISLLNVMNALIASKIDYGLYLYGNCPKSQINIVKSLYNAGIRTALGALASTPINNLLFESCMPTIEQRRENSILKLSKMLLNSADYALKDSLLQMEKSKRKFGSCCVLNSVVDSCKAREFPYKPLKVPRCKHPPWMLRSRAIDISLSILPKGTTPVLSYLARYEELRDKYCDYSFIFTDGSKDEEHISFSVTTTHSVIKQSVLPAYSSVFSAEIIAIYVTLYLLLNTQGKFAICTDSLSAIQAVCSVESTNFYAISIRKILLNYYPKFMLIWIPGHSRIPGNELADSAAKDALKRPLISYPNFNMNDISRDIKYNLRISKTDFFRLTNNWYQTNNMIKSNLVDFMRRNSLTFNRSEIVKIIRLRLGHCRISQLRFFEPDIPENCYFCRQNGNMSITHLLNDCVKFSNIRKLIFGNTNPVEALFSQSTTDTQRIINFLKDTKLFNLI